MLKIEQVGGKQKTGSGPSVWEGLFQCVSALFGDLVIYFIFRGGYCHACLPACPAYCWNWNWMLFCFYLFFSLDLFNPFCRRGWFVISQLHRVFTYK